MSVLIISCFLCFLLQLHKLTLWIPWDSSSDILSYFGVLSLGIGDALVSPLIPIPLLHIYCRMNKESNADHYMCDSQASIVGRRIGRLRWCSVFGKTVEGSVAFFFSVLGASWIMWLFGIVDDFNVRSSKSFFPLLSAKTRGRTEITDLFLSCNPLLH